LPQLSCKGWHQEAALRMLMNNLDPEVAERPDELIVYGGGGKAARDWRCYHTIVETLRRLENDETLLVQSGKPVGVFRTHEEAPRVLIANAHLVPRWGTIEEFRRLDALGLTMYGQMTAGSWIYIGSQGIVQGTYETFAECARQCFGGTLAGRLVVTAGLGGMGGAQPLAATMNGAAFLGIPRAAGADPPAARARAQRRRLAALGAARRRPRSPARDRADARQLPGAPPHPLRSSRQALQRDRHGASPGDDLDGGVAGEAGAQHETGGAGELAGGGGSGMSCSSTE
jgi:hypothetical protein